MTLKGAFVLIILGSVLLISDGVLAQVDPKTAPPVTLTLTPVFDQPGYDFNTPLATVQQLALDTKNSIHESLTLGLTRYKPFLQFSVPLKGATNTLTGVTCMHLENANVQFGYHDVTVYIAQEITYQSCGFQEVYQHEQKHIDVNWQVLQDYAPLIQSTLQDYLNKFGVICTPDITQTKQQIDQAFNTMLAEWNEQINTENRRRQQLVDSPEEYKRITDSCGGQLQDVARRFVNNHR